MFPKRIFESVDNLFPGFLFVMHGQTNSSLLHVNFITISKHNARITIMPLNGKRQINGYRSHIAQIFRAIVFSSALSTIEDASTTFESRGMN